MIAENQQINKIVGLLWAGDTSEAKRLIAVESDSLNSQIIDLKEELYKLESSLGTLQALTPSTGNQLPLGEARTDSIKKSNERELTYAQKRLRKREILRAASELSEDGKEFTSDDIAEMLLKSGVVIGVPDNRVNTAIGAVFRRRDDYERVAKGVYRKRRDDLPPESASL